jgi:hypothetical protein
MNELYLLLDTVHKQSFRLIKRNEEKNLESKNNHHI